MARPRKVMGRWISQRGLWREYRAEIGNMDTGPNAHHRWRLPMLRRMTYNSVEALRLQAKYAGRSVLVRHEGVVMIVVAPVAYLREMRIGRHTACKLAGLHRVCQRRGVHSVVPLSNVPPFRSWA